MDYSLYADGDTHKVPKKPDFNDSRCNNGSRQGIGFANFKYICLFFINQCISHVQLLKSCPQYSPLWTNNKFSMFRFCLVQLCQH